MAKSPGEMTTALPLSVSADRYGSEGALTCHYEGLPLHLTLLIESRKAFTVRRAWVDKPYLHSGIAVASAI